MQPRNNSLPIILAVIAGLLVVGICGATLLSIGALAWLLPARSVATQMDVIEATVEMETPAAQPTDVLPTSTTQPTTQPGTPTSEPQTAEPAPARVVYIGTDGNLWLVDLPANSPRMVTEDATPIQGSTPPYIDYNEPRLSSDGRFVAFRRGEGVQQAEGMSIDFGLWVVDLASGEGEEIYDMSPSGYSWKPGSHVLAYIPELTGNYFLGRDNQPDPALANPIFSYDADSGETQELVQPEGGLAMWGPVWSPDGRFLSFDEVLYMEGRGPFAYYDFDAQEYISLGEPLGIYSWSPDGEMLAYDNLTYVANGEERIFLRSRQGGDVSEFSAPLEAGYAIMPVFSPQGDQVAYEVNYGGPENQLFTLFVQPYPQGEPRQLGEFESIFMINWTPDGTRLVFSAGPWGEQWIYTVDVQTGEAARVQQGSQPAISAVP